MKLHNTLNRKQETTEFSPLNKGVVRMYSCGPTVYDHIHIGNLRAFIVADTLRRSLQAAGYTAEHVMNFTDVDDKTIKRSHERYPDLEPMEALQKLTREYEALFIQDMEAIGCDTEAIEFVRATENIEPMQYLIRELLKDEVAYIAEDGIYFSIRAYQQKGKTYGQLLKLNTATTSEARIDNDEYDKESVRDFALWKVQKDDEPAWDFDINGQNVKGRPGWHIECSAMSTDKLGQPFDIHTGGVDLIFPHHENEIAQSTATGDDTYARYFVHNEHLLVDGKKMSKSLGNFFTLDDIRKRGFDPLAFRLLVLQSHYRKQMNFTWESLEAAQNRLYKWYEAAERRWQEDSAADSGEANISHAERLIMTAETDLNTPSMLAIIDAFIDQITSGHYCMPCIENFSLDIERLLGINILSATPNISEEQRELLRQRQTARDNKDWTRSDALRDSLSAQGIAVQDSEHGQIWSRTR